MGHALDSIGASLCELSSAVERLEMYMFSAGGEECDLGLSRYSMQWRQVAIVLDRLFFVMYVIAIVCSLLTLFPRESPNIPATTT